MKRLFCILLVTTLALPAFSQPFIERSVARAETQIQAMVDKLAFTRALPRSIDDKTGEFATTGIRDWVSGFFPGVLWRMYEVTGDHKWSTYARVWTAGLEPLRNYTANHDIGFMVGCSFGNGYRLTGDTAYIQIIVDAAESLCTRYNAKVGLIKSWDWMKDGQYPVIIDNMMNLELLFMASRLTGDMKYYDIAVSHADKTMANHFRADNSSWHVVDYDPSNGKVRWKRTHQGYSDDSAWSRGQAWGLYGYTMCYRETGDVRYREQAEKIAGFMLSHKNLPSDYVFYWDFDAPDIPKAPRDASAAAITASGLLELSKYSETNRQRYFDAAERMLRGLSDAPYLSPEGGNHDFILTNSVGSFPHGREVSAPLSYADYYFVEALVRYIEYN